VHPPAGCSAMPPHRHQGAGRCTSGKLRRDWLTSLCTDIWSLNKEGRQLVLASPGSIALGRGLLKPKPADYGWRNPSPCSGQVRSPPRCRHRHPRPHVLLTFGDTEERHRYLNARATLGTLIGLGAVPMINAIDTSPHRDQVWRQ